MRLAKTRLIPVAAAIALILICAPAAQASLQYKGEFGSFGNGAGQFELPDGLAVGAGDDVYVTDVQRNNVQRFNSSGQYELGFGSLGNGNGEFNSPFGIGIDYLGFVYVADTLNNRIQQFTSSGVYLRQWGAFGNGNGQFDRPSAVAAAKLVDNSVHALVSDQLNSRVQMFTTLGAYETQIPAGGGQIIDIASNGGSGIPYYLADATNRRVARYGFGNLLGTFGTQGSGDGQFEVPQGLDVDSVGNVWVVDSQNDNLQKFGATGQFLARYGGSGSQPGQFDSPRDVEVADDGTIYVVDAFNSRVQMFTEVADPAPPSNQPADPPAQPPAADAVAPDLIVSARRRQRIKRNKLVLKVTCRNEACAATTGIAGSKKRARYRAARSRKLHLGAGKQRKLTIRLTRKSLRKARSSLRRHRRVTVRVEVTATDAAGNSSSKTRSIALRR